MKMSHIYKQMETELIISLANILFKSPAFSMHNIFRIIIATRSLYIIFSTLIDTYANLHIQSMGDEGTYIFLRTVIIEHLTEMVNVCHNIIPRQLKRDYICILCWSKTHKDDKKKFISMSVMKHKRPSAHLRIYYEFIYDIFSNILGDRYMESSEHIQMKKIIIRNMVYWYNNPIDSIVREINV